MCIRDRFNAHRVAKLADVLAIDAICKEYHVKYVYGQFGAAADRALMLILRSTQPYMLVAQAQVATGIPGQKRALITYIERELAK